MSDVKLTEIGGAILWAASLVAVTGYTWDAYTSTYSAFPVFGGSVGGGGGIAGYVSSQVDKTAKTAATIGDAILGVGQGSAPFGHVNPHDGGYRKMILQAARSGDRRKTQALLKAWIDYARNHGNYGWNDQNIATWAISDNPIVIKLIGGAGLQKAMGG